MKFYFAQISTFSQRYKRRAIIVGLCILTLFVIFSILGMIFLPGVIKDKACQIVEQELHRKLTIQDISFNPLSLSVTLDGVKLTERKSDQTFVSLDKLYINVSTFSAFTFYPIIREVEIVNPYVHLSRESENTYNISDIIEMAMKPDENPDKKTLSYSVNNIQITGGKIIFDDHPKGDQHKIEDLVLKVPYFSSAPSSIDTYVEPYLSAKLNGTKVELTGKTKPLSDSKETSLSLYFKDIALPRYMEYLPYKPAFRLANGLLSLDLNLSFIQSSSKKTELKISGNVSIDKFKASDLQNNPLLGFEKLFVKLAQNDILANDFHIDKIELTRPSVHALIDNANTLNLMAFAPQPSFSKASLPSKNEESSAVNVVLKQFIMHDGQFSFINLADELPYSADAKEVNVTIDNVALHLREKNLHIGKITSDKAVLVSALEKESSKRVIRKSESSSDSNFNVNIDQIAVSGWSAQMESKSKRIPVGGKIYNLVLNMKDLSTERNKVSSIDLTADVEKKGHILVNGQFGIAPLYADINVDIKDLSMVMIQQYIDQQVNLTLRQADLTTKGHLALSEGTKGTLKGSYKGDVSIHRLNTVDQIKGDSFVRWDKLAFNQVNVNLDPFSFSAKEASLNGAFARLILYSQGRLNIQNILRNQAGGKKSLTDSEMISRIDLDAIQSGKVTTQKEATPKEAIQSEQVTSDLSKEQETSHSSIEQANEIRHEQVASESLIMHQELDKTVEMASEKKQAKSLPPIKIDRFLINNVNVRFTDNFIKPNYTATLSKLKGAVTRISTKKETSALIDLKGIVNRAPLTISGNIAPFDPEHSLEIKAQVKGMELAQFSSYTNKYVGYGIEKGKLSFDVAYKVEQGELSAENHLVLDQLTFSDQKAENPVMSLPVQFAVNLLKDGNGVIDINLPVSGSLNDPQFSVGGVIFKLVINLIKKAVTAPFSLLTAAFGGSEELSFYEFIPGSSNIQKETEEKLTNIAKALKNRPALSLDITGCYDPVVDRSGAAKASISRKIREMKRKDMGDETIRLSEIKVSDQEYAKYLKEIYSDSDFKKPRNFIGFQKSLPQAEMEKLIYENYPISEEEFMALADKRAANIKIWFIEKGSIPQERIFIHASKSKSGNNSTRADFSLH